MVTAGKQTLQHDEASGMSYWLYTPASHTARSLWPLLLVLHGAGELGSDPHQLLSEGATGVPVKRLASLIAGEGLGDTPPELAEEFVVVSPQSRRGWRARELAALVESLARQEQLKLDRRRLFVTGVSMGGAGTVAAAGTGLFAAAVPVCAAGGDASLIHDRTAVWLFHGANDVVVDVSYSDELHVNLRAKRARCPPERRCGELKYTRYDRTPAPVGWPSYDGHASWIMAYAERDLWRWLLTQSLE